VTEDCCSVDKVSQGDLSLVEPDFPTKYDLAICINKNEYFQNWKLKIIIGR